MLEGVHELDRCLRDVDYMLQFRLKGDSLGEHLNTLELGLSLLGIILAHSSLEGLTAFTSADMLDSDVNSLGDDSASVLLVDDDSDGVLGHVENAASLSMVELVRHALVDATVSNDVNDIVFPVSLHDL